MISTMFYALLTDRAYLLNWSPLNPLPLETIWERPHVEWAHDPEEMEALFTDEKNPLLGYQKVDTLNKKFKVLTSMMFPDGGNTELKDLWNGTVKYKSRHSGIKCINYVHSMLKFVQIVDILFVLSKSHKSIPRS